jgi:hypothetical protein
MSPRAALRVLLAAAVLSLVTSAGAQDGDWDDSREGGAQGGYDVQVDVDGASAATLETFQSGLSPYGDWVRSGAYGTAWRPRVATGWRPYYYGRWEWTNEGWLWVSEEPFGWATYHYGRWAWDGGLGWVWVPGYQWAPAWVSWRFGGDVVGWAPLAPGLSLYVTNYAFIDFWWTFVPSARFCGSPVWGMAYAPSRAYQFYGVTSPAPPRPRSPALGRPPGGGSSGRPAPGMRSTPGWGGPPPRYIEERTGRPIQPSRIVVEPRPGAARGRAGEVGVYRPEIPPRAGGAMRPVPTERPRTPAGPMAPVGRPAIPVAPGGRTVVPARPSAPGSLRQGNGWERSAPPAQRAPATAPAAPRSEGRQGPAPRGSVTPYGGAPSNRGATPHGGGLPRGGGEAPRGGSSVRPDGAWRHR